jgi:hypothetical protein
MSYILLTCTCCSNFNSFGGIFAGSVGVFHTLWSIHVGWLAVSSDIILIVGPIRIIRLTLVEMGQVVLEERI